MTFRTTIEDRVSQLRKGRAYQNYLDVRALVFGMMDAWENSNDSGSSAYWREETEGFDYLFDASPLIVDRLREQCYHITGLKSYEYRAHHNHKAALFENKYKMLAAVDGTGLFAPESPMLGGFGFEFGKGLVNVDTLKFYEAMIGLERSGALAKLREEGRRIVVEIGSGWGGFAYVFKKTLPNATYVCFDLPPTMLFSGTYLKTVFPDASFLFYGESGFDEKARSLSEYDFVFLPHFYFSEFNPPSLDLAVNMVSFQEMTTDQVNCYASGLRDLDCSAVYSLNRDRSKHNSELTSVRDVLSRYYPLKDVQVLDIQYTELTPPKGERRELGIFDYRHCLAGA